MYICTRSYIYIPIKGIVSVTDDNTAVVRTDYGDTTKHLDDDAVDTLLLLSKRFIEDLDKNKNVAMTPIDTITKIRLIGWGKTSKNIVTTQSGEDFYLCNDIYKSLHNITQECYDFPV